MKYGKLKKLIIVLVLISAIFLSGCKTENNQIKIEKPLLDISIYPDGIPVYISLPSSIKPPVEEYFEWNEYIREKYELTFDLKYVDYIFDTENVMEKVDTSMGLDINYYKNLDPMEGYIKLIEPGDLTGLINADLIIPLNQYIPEIHGLASMNQRVFERFTDPDGNIWAFPDSGQISMTHRVYNKQLLDRSGFSIPADIWEFLDYAKYIKTQDLDRNGIDDTYIQDYNASSVPANFSDIFAAFGCYFNLYLPVAYNPLIEKYELVVENENFESALIYILNLKEEGLIRETGYDLLSADGSTTKGYTLGSAAGVFSFDAVDSFDEWEFGSCMTGENDRLLGQISTPRTGFAVLKDTKNTEDIMNAIYELTDDLTGHCDFNYGREGYNYTIVDNKINVIRITKDNQFRYPMQLLNTRYFDIEENGYYVSRNDKTEENNIKQKHKFLKEQEEYEKSLINTNYAYSLPFEANNTDILALNLALINETEKLFEDIFKRNVEIDTAIQSFMKVYMELDGAGIVSEENQQMGN